jgi:hypothetical protein
MRKWSARVQLLRKAQEFLRRFPEHQHLQDEVLKGRRHNWAEGGIGLTLANPRALQP